MSIIKPTYQLWHELSWTGFLIVQTSINKYKTSTLVATYRLFHLLSVQFSLYLVIVEEKF